MVISAAAANAGGKDKDIVGKTLGKGTYTALAGLSRGQRESKITIYLEYPEAEK